MLVLRDESAPLCAAAHWAAKSSCERSASRMSIADDAVERASADLPLRGRARNSTSGPPLPGPVSSSV